MKQKRRTLAPRRAACTAIAIAILAIASAARAAITISTVTIGNTGNTADTRVMNDGTSSYGQVNYTYNLGKYEVTAAQYTAFLNAVAATDTYGLYNTAMTTDQAGCQIIRSGASGSYTYSVASDYANRPVNYVSWGDSVRFCNWFANGQPTGTQTSSTTENGSYTLNGASTATALLSITRKTSATWVVPSENEWYKAAFYNPTSNSYYEYATSSNTLPSNVLTTPDAGNSANYLDAQSNATLGSPYYRTTVGAFTNSSSPSGTFDQNGNVWEWNESTFYNAFKGLRGGSLGDYDVTLSASFRYFDMPDYESNTTGFRVASLLLRGDFNADGQITTADIPAMLQALTDLNAYKTSKSLTDAALLAIGDFTGDGTVSNFDIQPLLNLVATSGSGSLATVPEPSTVFLALFGAVAAVCLSRKRKVAR